MNKQRRKTLEKHCDELSDIASAISSIAEEIEFSYENLTEGLQATERGKRMEEEKDELYDVVSEIDNLIGRIIDIL